MLAQVSPSAGVTWQTPEYSGFLKQQGFTASAAELGAGRVPRSTASATPKSTTRTLPVFMGIATSLFFPYTLPRVGRQGSCPVSRVTGARPPRPVPYPAPFPRRILDDRQAAPGVGSRLWSHLPG